MYMKILIEESLENLSWMSEPIEKRRFSCDSLNLILKIFDKIKLDYMPYGYDVTIRDTVGAKLIAIQANQKMINMYHFRSDLNGLIGSITLFGNDLHENFNEIRNDGFVFHPKLKVSEIAFCTKNVPSPQIQVHIEIY